MIEKTCNFWDESGDAHVITTNGVVKGNGACVMGRGIALQAKIKFPGIDKILGAKIIEFGNHVHNLGEFVTDEKTYTLFALPVKEHWKDKADILLIARSLSELVTQTLTHKKIIIVRPGCGNGKLRWEFDVKPLIENYLDDKFIIVNQF